jgi:hypothetical protein
MEHGRALSRTILYTTDPGLGQSARARHLELSAVLLAICDLRNTRLVLRRSRQPPSTQTSPTYKSNLAAFPPALPFRLVPSAHGVATVAWDDPSPLSAAALLVPPLPDEERDALDEATAILRDLLKDGPRPAADILPQARSALGIRAQMRQLRYFRSPLAALPA